MAKKTRMVPEGGNNNPKVMKIPAMKGTVLGLQAFRGYAPLSLLSKISKPDIYDQLKNPTGTQRDLKPKHAQEVYSYAKEEENAFFPEVVLNVRSWDDENIFWEPLNPESGEEEFQFGHLCINPSFFAAQPEVLISRVDGNHRLALAGGMDPDFEQVDRSTSFCVLNMEQWNPLELKIFRDVNENPVKMSATHLYQAITRLFSEEELKKEYPYIWMANQLGDDPSSVFQNQIYRGAGSKRGYLIKLNQIASSIEEFLETSQRLDVVEDVSNRYKLVREFWKSIRIALPQTFEEPRNYVVLKSPGLYAMGRVCAAFVDEGLATGEITPGGDLVDGEFFNDRLALASSAFDWASGGDFEGLQGKAGGQKIARKILTAVHKLRPEPSKSAK